MFVYILFLIYSQYPFTELWPQIATIYGIFLLFFPSKKYFHLRCTLWLDLITYYMMDNDTALTRCLWLGETFSSSINFGSLSPIHLFNFKLRKCETSNCNLNLALSLHRQTIYVTQAALHAYHFKLHASLSLVFSHSPAACHQSHPEPDRCWHAAAPRL